MNARMNRREFLGSTAALLAGGSLPGTGAAGFQVATFSADVTVPPGHPLRAALKSATMVTHLGLGQAKVEKVASNRRYLGDDGKPRFDRGSATRDPKARAKGEGTIDPYLKTLSLWNGDRPVAALSVY